MKKFQSLGRSLSKTEQKMIFGGIDQDPIGEGTACTDNSQCQGGNLTVTCPDGRIVQATGFCNLHTLTCYKSGIC